jgi:LemA protein
VLVLIIAIVVAALVVLWAIVTYNRLIRQRLAVDNSWSQIEVQLKRRHDLIPNLVETVKGYAAHERTTFEEVTRARGAAVQAATQGAPGGPQQAAAEGMLSAALGRLLALAEAYPQLQADENFRQLQGDLADTENRIAIARQVYNDTVQTYNSSIQVFPNVIVARPFGFTERAFFDAPATDEAAPEVSFAAAPGAEAAGDRP